MAEEIEKSRYGIICVTKENVGKPWINFEAGALSRSIEKSTVLPFSSAVSPFLFDLKSSDLEGPLTQFQYVVNERGDILKLIASINSKVEDKQLAPDKLQKAFDRCWPDLESKLTKVSNEGLLSTEPRAPARKPDEILTELLELVRSQQRLMMSKEDTASLLASLGASIRADLVQSLRQGGFGLGFGTSFGQPVTLHSFASQGVLGPEALNATTVVQKLPGPTTNVAVRTTGARMSTASKEQQKEQPNKGKPVVSRKPARRD